MTGTTSFSNMSFVASTKAVLKSSIRATWTVPMPPVRTLLAMMALKEGFDWSDSQLYEQVHFNLMVMKALGFENLTDKAPAPSTYYLFKHAVCLI